MYYSKLMDLLFESGFSEWGQFTFWHNQWSFDSFISLQEIMNFTYTVIKPPDGQYGGIQSDGTMSGMIGLLANQDIDIAPAPFSVTKSRSTVMTFASSITEVYFTLFIKNPAENFNIMAYVEPMHWLAWVGMFVLLATVPPFLYLAVR